MGKHTMVGLVLVGALLSFGIGISGYFVSQTLYNSKIASNIAQARGLAEQRVKSDRANWKIYFSVTENKDSDIAALYERFELDQKTILAELKSLGFGAGEISANAARYLVEEYRNEDKVVVDRTYSLSGTINIDTEKVALVSPAQAKLGKLIAKGISLENSTPTFQYTKLNDIKPEMLKEATKNARIAATTFAENVGARVGGIKSARQGSFTIRDAGEEYGDRFKIDKDIRVVTTVSFYIEN